MRTIPVFSLIISFISFSCTTQRVSVIVPASIRDSCLTLHVDGVKNRGIFNRHLIRVDSLASGKISKNWRSVDKQQMQSPFFPLEFDNRMRFLAGHFSREMYTSGHKFRLSLKIGNQNLQAYCAESTDQETFGARQGVLSLIALSGHRQYRFSAILFEGVGSSAKMPWQLEFDSSQNIGLNNTNDLSDLVDHTSLSEGLLKNDSLAIRLIPTKLNLENGKSVMQQMPFGLFGGYEYRLNDHTIAFVNLYSETILIKENVDARLRPALITSAVALLVRQNP